GDDVGEPVPVTPSDAPPPNFLMLHNHTNVAALARLPFWIQAAIRLGVRFIRVAAASEPPASTGFARHHQAGEPVCCVECGKPHPVVVDEFYFWMLDSRFYDTTPQNQTIPQDAEWSWHDANFLPQLLHWDSEPMVHLAWCRVHNGEFKQPRRSFDGVPVTPGT